MDKKTIIAVVLSLAVLLAWQRFFMPKPAPVAPQVQSIVIDNKSQTPLTQEQATAVPLETSAALVTTEAAEDIVITAEKISVVFNSITGDIRKISILGWKDTDNDSITFNKGSSSDYLKIITSVSEKADIKRSTVDGDEVISFTSSMKGLIVTKEYRIPKSDYLIKTAVKIINSRDITLSVPLQVSIGPSLGQGFEKSSYIKEGAVIHSAADTERVEMTKSDSATLPTPLWAGYASKYFLVAAASKNFERADITSTPGGVVASITRSITVNPDANYTESFDIYAGPKAYRELKVYALGLEASIDFGWFYFLAIPMLQVLLFIAGIVKNYGVAIIILTIMVKIITLPLTMKGMKSMKAMTKLQPEMVKLKEKYKGDPQKMNAATMELYKKNKVNPMSGCLPLLIQIPIFFALYKALLLSIELKGAPFIFYLTDLSAKDPYYITPIVMGATMFLQQKLTPSTADPMQQKIFLFMPIIFTVLFINFPSGLVIYWLTNNVLSIAQQLIVNKSGNSKN